VPDPAPAGWWITLGRFLEIQNLGLNLPFVLAILVVATEGRPTFRVGLLVVLAFVAARNAGHSFNRWADRELDSQNPRTQGRLLVAHPELAPLALLFAVANALLLGICSFLLSPLALWLVPVALGLTLGYSYTKRFTSLTTVFLGLVEGIIPAAVYAGATNWIPIEGFVASFGLLAWGTSFELIHSLGDRASDAKLGLRSIPVQMGVDSSLGIMVGAQAVAYGLFAAFGWLVRLGAPFFLGLIAMGVLTGYVDRLVFATPPQTQRPFRLHFVLSGLFLLSVLFGVFGPAL
jgi:4-hydroxybenzoate polyprenyltransferase